MKGLRKEMAMFFWLYVVVALIVVFGPAVLINRRRRHSISYDSGSAARLAQAQGYDNIRHAVGGSGG
jgi:preprotein translocase subunit SecG